MVDHLNIEATLQSASSTFTYKCCSMLWFHIVRLGIVGFCIVGFSIVEFIIVGLVSGFSIMVFCIVGFSITGFGIVGFTVVGFSISEFNILLRDTLTYKLQKGLTFCSTCCTTEPQLLHMHT